MQRITTNRLVRHSTMMPDFGTIVLGMGFRPRISGLLYAALFALMGCAAATTWDDYEKAGVTLHEPDASTSSSSGSTVTKEDGGTDGENSPVQALQATSFGFENSAASVDVTFEKPLTEGSTILVAVGWYNVENDIASITDNVGGTYEIAAEPISFNGSVDVIWQKLFFSRKMKGEKNYKLTVKWASAVETPDVRISEVIGLNPTTPLIKMKQSSGKDKTFSVGPLTVDGPGLVFAASTGEGTYQDCASDFIVCDVNPETGNLAEIKLLPKGGSLTVTNEFDATNEYVIQAAAFH